MEPKLTQLKIFKQTVLTDEERNLMRAHAARITIASPVLVTESFFKRGVQHGLRIALSSMLFALFIAASVSLAANDSLPGNPLYLFKVNINENIQRVLAGKTATQQAINAAGLVENRANEIQTLAESNSLTKAKQEIAEKALSNNIQDLSTNLNTLSAQAPEAALTVTASLEQTLQANKTAIENTPDSSDTSDTSKADALKTVDATLQKVSNQEVQIISNEIDSINTAVNTVPTTAVAQTPTTPPVIVTPATP